MTRPHRVNEMNTGGQAASGTVRFASYGLPVAPRRFAVSPRLFVGMAGERERN